MPIGGKRRQYLGGVVFNPKGAPEDCWNSWSGFTVTPAPGDWSAMREHIRSVICSGVPELFDYVINWLARMFQRPEERGEVALVVRGAKGAGKGIFFNWLLEGWGQHGIHIVNAKHLTGQFNDHLRDCVLLFADEAFYAGDKQHESILKGLITEPTLAIEGKYKAVVQVANMLHLVIASNADWVVPASSDERRYMVLDAADNRVGQRDYFNKINLQMRNGGLAAMIFDLLRRDISKFDPRDIPDTQALHEQKLLSLDSLHRWWLTVLEREFVWKSRFGSTVFTRWHDFYATELLWRSYCQWCDETRPYDRKSRVQLGQFFTALYQPCRPRDGSAAVPLYETERLDVANPIVYAEGRPRGYSVGDIDAARANFADRSKISGDWACTVPDIQIAL
jgi:Family of unknown function (DUF5906)